MVKESSLRRDNLTVHCTIADTAKEVPILYPRILPDLFKEKKGAVAQDCINPDGAFASNEVLAKHVEKFIPHDAWAYH